MSGGLKADKNMALAVLRPNEYCHLEKELQKVNELLTLASNDLE